MKINVNAINLNPQKAQVGICIEIPRKCPRCEVAYAEDPQATFIFDERGMHSKEGSAYSVYFCPHCGQCFLAEYNLIMFHDSLDTRLVKTYPYSKAKTNFSKAISNLSPDFVEIYHQSEEAEHAGLPRVCGFGYRKALEFLVKDYAINKDPAQADIIKKKSLSDCITDYINSEDVRKLAKASTWLGNDEAHYIRKHPNYDCDDLKLFLQATVLAIDFSLTCEKANDLVGSQK